MVFIMMRKTRIFSLLAAAAVSVSMLASCGSSDSTIAVISREDGSGTRGAFIELTGVEAVSYTHLRAHET